MNKYTCIQTYIYIQYTKKILHIVAETAFRQVSECNAPGGSAPLCMYMYIYLSIYLYIYLFVYLSILIYIYVCLYTWIYRYIHIISHLVSKTALSPGIWVQCSRGSAPLHIYISISMFRNRNIPLHLVSKTAFSPSIWV